MNLEQGAPVRAAKDGAVLTIKLHPGVSPAGVREVRDGELHVRVGAPPDKGRANAELIAVLAAFFKERKSCIEIISGATSRKKQVLIREASADALLAKLKEKGIVSS